MNRRKQNHPAGKSTIPLKEREKNKLNSQKDTQRKLLRDRHTDKELTHRDKKKTDNRFPSSPMPATLFCCQQSWQ